MILAVALHLLLAQAAASPGPASSDQCNQEATVIKADYPHLTEPPSVVPLHAVVAVVVAPNGTVKSASINQSSGDLGFDMASIRAAKNSLFNPKLVNCQAVEATYLFKTNLFAGRRAPPPNRE
jgi:TonB family protein